MFICKLCIISGIYVRICSNMVFHLRLVTHYVYTCLHACKCAFEGTYMVSHTNFHTNI